MSPVHGFTSSNTNSNGNAVGGSAAAGTANARATTPSSTATSHLTGALIPTSFRETRSAHLSNPMIDPACFRAVSDAQQAASVPGQEGRQMEFRILGPLEAWDGCRELSLGGR